MCIRDRVKVPTMSVSYRTHVQTFGWEKSWSKDGAMSGTSGKAKRLEGIEINVSGNDKVGIQYTTHCQSSTAGCHGHQTET